MPSATEIEKTDIRQVSYCTGRAANGKQRFTEKMKRKIDTATGRAIYEMRLAVGEPLANRKLKGYRNSIKFSLVIRLGKFVLVMSTNHGMVKTTLISWDM